MKKLLTMLVAVGVVLGLSFSASAQITDEGVFPIKAVIPAATQIAFVVSEAVDGGDFEPLGEGSQTLTFDMEYDTDNGIWLPKKFFIIDLATRDDDNEPAAGGSPDLTISYEDTKNQNNAGAPGGGTGLEAKGVITVVSVTGPADDQDESDPPLYKDTFGTITGSGFELDESNFIGGFARVYLGISDGTGIGSPFTNSDNPGSYEGTITLSATLD